MKPLQFAPELREPPTLPNQWKTTPFMPKIELRSSLQLILLPNHLTRPAPKEISKIQIFSLSYQHMVLNTSLISNQRLFYNHLMWSSCHRKQSAAGQCQNCARAQKRLNKSNELDSKGKHLSQESLAPFQAKRRPIPRPEAYL